MPDLHVLKGVQYSTLTTPAGLPAGNTHTLTTPSSVQNYQALEGSFGPLQVDDNLGTNDETWNYNEAIQDVNSLGYSPFGLDDQATFFATIIINGTVYPIVHSSDQDDYIILFYGTNADTDANFAASSMPTIGPGTGPGQYNTSGSFTQCFGEGTKLAVPGGETAVEDLAIGDLVTTADGRSVPVVWIGYQDIFPVFAAGKDQPVRISAGALGKNLPTEDLIVTADHGIMVDCCLVNAAALVNHDTIDFVSSEEMQMLRVYHVETEHHEVVLANGCPTESFYNLQDRSSFANYGEYLDLYGADRMVIEMDAPRITSHRLIPAWMAARLDSSVVTDEKVQVRSA